MNTVGSNMSQPSGFCYESSNNIIIIPTVSFIKNKAMPPQKLDTTTKQVLVTEQKVKSGEKVLTSNNTNQPNPKSLVTNQSQPTITTSKIVQSLKPEKPKTLEKQHTNPSLEICNGDVNKNLSNVEDLNKAKKVSSWASNYLQSIGHSYLKPIKQVINKCHNKNKCQDEVPICSSLRDTSINLSTSKNKLESNKAISSKSNDSRNIPSVPLKVTTTPSYKDINMMNDRTNEKIIGDKTKTNVRHINSKPTNARGTFVNKTSDIHMNKGPAVPASKNIVSTNIILDTIYSNDSNNSRAPATLPAKGNSEATDCYKAGNREIDILDAIKSKMNRANVQQESRMMNLPTHKDMCEKFIKEINNKSATSERKKRDHSKASAKNEELIRPAKPHAQHGKVKENDDKHKKLPDDSSKSFKKQTSDKNLTKKSKVSSKVEKTEKKNEKYNQHKELQKNKLIVNLKDFDNLKRHADKETAKYTKAPEKQKLKRTRTISKDNIHSPIKSVIKVAENCPSNPPKRQRLDESFDLRSKLSRVNQRMSNNTHVHNDSQALNKKIKRENLKICVDNKMERKQNSPKKSGVLKYKKSNCRKLKLIINVVCQESDDDNSSSDSSYNESENNQSHNMDLSFLDDFNVDEIVDCLKHSPKKKIRSPLLLESKMEDSIKNTPDPEIKLSAVLGLLNANKFKTTGETEFNVEDIMINKSSVRQNTVQEKEIENSYFNQNNNLTTQDLLKILSQSNMQIDQEKTKSSEICHKITKDTYVGVLDKFYKENKQQSSDNGRLNIDESVVISDHKISIIDLTDDTFSRPSSIQSENQSVNKQAYEKSVEINNIVHDDSIKLIENDINQKCSCQTLRNTVIIKVEPAILNKNEEIIIDLTNRDEDYEINKLNLGSNKAAVENNYTNLQVADQNCTIPEIKDFNENLKINQEYDIHLIPLPNSNVDNTPEETVDIVKVKTESVKDEQVTKKSQINVRKEKVVENKTENVQDDSNETIYKDYARKQHLETQLCTMVANEKTEKIHQETNIKIQEKNDNVKENITNVYDSGKAQNIVTTKVNTSKGAKNACQIFKTKAVKEILSAKTNKIQAKNVPENVPEMTRKVNNESKNKPRITNNKKIDNNKPQGVASKTSYGTKNKPVITPKTNNDCKIKPTINFKSIGDSKITLGASITSNDTKKQAEIVTKFNNNIKKKLVMVPKTNNSINKPRTTFKTNIDTKKQPEIVSKPNDDTKNEPVMAPKTNNPINISEQKEVEIVTNPEEDTKIEPENTSKTNSETKNESAISKRNTTTNENNGSTILTGTHKMLADLLEQRMFDYLHKDIKVIKHIHLGKYSNIFSCKDSSGQTYAAKVLKNQNDRNALGIEKEQMIRKLQQDIPKENLNTVYLIDGFGIERHWCFLTEYYPENLKQALQANKKGFHIDQVQDLARQLISAVMVLRCNDIVHSDIKPSHILINATHDRIKLCGFDAAYHINNALPLPNIGTVLYRAPEVILGFSAGHSIDVWSSALVIYQMATNQKLINAFFNNGVLYKQMCIFGSLPWDMLDASVFKNRHFQGRTFMRRVGVRGQDAILYQRFYKTDRLYNSLMHAYNKDWKSSDVYQTDSDNFKLTALHKLLEQMLVPDPRLRIAIEFVSVDPFIYQIQPLMYKWYL